MIILKFTFHIPYRQLEGFFRSFFSQLGIKEVPNFRTIFYRFTKIPEELKEMLIKIDVKELPEDFVIAIDSTGIKLSNRGEWLSKKQKERSRKGWVKLHVAMDIHSHQVVDIKITDESVGDSEVGLELVRDCNRALQEQGKRIQKVLGDKGYDTYEIFERLKQMGIEPAIMVRESAQENGKKRGNTIFKRIFGGYVVSKKSNNIINELLFKVFIMNMFIKV